MPLPLVALAIAVAALFTWWMTALNRASRSINPSQPRLPPDGTRPKPTPSAPPENIVIWTDGGRQFCQMPDGSLQRIEGHWPLAPGLTDSIPPGQPTAAQKEADEILRLADELCNAIGFPAFTLAEEIAHPKGPRATGAVPAPLSARMTYALRFLHSFSPNPVKGPSHDHPRNAPPRPRHPHPGQRRLRPHR